MESEEPEDKLDKPKPPKPSKLGSKDRKPGTSRDVTRLFVKTIDSKTNPSFCTRLRNYLYNKENKTICGRTGKSWLYIISYSLIYLLFLCTYMMIFLYATLLIIKMNGEYQFIDKTELLTYSDHGIGLSATPTSVNNLPLIWYKDRDEKSYQKYVKAIDDLLSNNIKRRNANVSDLGPCGQYPYGYGEKPCIIIRVNKHIGWAVNPVDVNSTNFKEVPVQIKELLKTKQRKMFLTCDGYHTYDKDHIGKISYFPNPPGIDASIFPLDMQSSSPLLAIQISDYTQGMSIAVECKLWYDGATASVYFLLYVTPKNTSV